MKKENIRKFLAVMLAGIVHSLKCTLAVTLLAAGILLLTCVPIESGYFAVGKFIAALLVFGISAFLFHICGTDLMKGKYSK
jgi:uncharacterized membrane protein YhfC